MALIVKKASELTAEEKAVMGITGIPNEWPIESFPYTGTTPEHFIVMTDVEFESLKANNQAAYDAWLSAIKVQTVQPNIMKVSLDSPSDVDGRLQIRRIVTKPNWYYSPHSIDWTTSKYKSIYNRKHDGNGIDDGTDPGDGWTQYYDINGNELIKEETESDAEYQARLDIHCVKTVGSFEKAVSFDLFYNGSFNDFTGAKDRRKKEQQTGGSIPLGPVR
jgi:hypothetical protein